MIAVIANLDDDSVARAKFGGGAGAEAEGEGSTAWGGGGRRASQNFAGGLSAAEGEGGADRFSVSGCGGGGECGSGVWA